MTDEVEFYYYTRFRRQSLDTDFQRRLTAALTNEIECERAEEELDKINSFRDDDDDQIELRAGRRCI